MYVYEDIMLRTPDKLKSNKSCYWVDETEYDYYRDFIQGLSQIEVCYKIRNVT